MAEAKMEIVLAWVVEDFEVVRERRRDLGERPELKTIYVPRTVMWLNSGTEADVKKATDYATKEKDHKVLVFTYPKSERDPLGRAKKDVMKRAKELIGS